MKSYLKNWIESPSKIFFSLAIIYGGIMAIVLPPFAAPDEPAHFYRAYQVSNLQVTSNVTNDNNLGGTVVEIPYTSDYYGATNYQIKEVGFPNTANYSPVGYIPQTIGIMISRMFNLPFGFMVLLGRLINLLIYVLLVCLAIKITPTGRWVYATLGLFPIAIQQASTLSVDSSFIGLCFITIAYIHMLFVKKTKFNSNNLFVLIVLTCGIALTKSYALVILLPIVFLQKNIFSSIKQKLIMVLAVFTTAFVSLFTWSGLTRVAGYQRINVYEKINLINVSPNLQLNSILENPLIFSKVLFKSYVFQGFGGFSTADFYLTSMYGYFSNFLYKLPLGLIFIGLVTLFIALLFKEKNEVVNKNLAFIQTVIFVICVLLTSIALYVFWTPVGAQQIDGIQGRYFIPFIPLFIPLFVLIRKWINVYVKNEVILGLIVCTVSVINLSLMILLTYKFFY